MTVDEEQQEGPGHGGDQAGDHRSGSAPGRRFPWRSAALRAGVMVAMLPLILAVIGVVVVQTHLRDRLVLDTQARLQGELTNIAALYDQRRVPAVRQAIEFRTIQGQDGDGGKSTVYLLLDRDARVLAGNVGNWPAGITAQDIPFDRLPAQFVQIDGAEYLGVAARLRGGFDLLVAVSTEPLHQTLARMMRVFAGFGLVMLFAGLAAAFLMARYADRRLARVNGFLSHVGQGGDMAARLSGADLGGDEYHRLAAHVNEMLDRISHLFEAHQRLGNAVAHEMRTPLSRIQARLEALDLDQAARAGLDEEIRATIRLFDALLSIAQMDGEAGRREGLSPVDLCQIAGGITTLYHPAADESGRVLIYDCTGLDGDRAMVLGDGNLLSQLMSNLIENGLKYTNPGDQITLSIRPNGGRLRVLVADTGPGAGLDAGGRAQQGDALFAPFARGPQGRDRPGHGLGLSLVRAIALRHGAIALVLPVDRGFAVAVDFIPLGHAESGD